MELAVADFYHFYIVSFVCVCVCQFIYVFFLFLCVRMCVCFCVCVHAHIHMHVLKYKQILMGINFRLIAYQVDTYPT